MVTGFAVTCGILMLAEFALIPLAWWQVRKGMDKLHLPITGMRRA